MKCHFFSIRRERGIALLLVLGALVLISIILVGFLATVRKDRSASAFYQSAATARQQADTAINLAVAQIAEATSDPDVAWISQPGLLRTFDTSGPKAAYKLYSSDQMKVEGAYDPESQLTTEVPANWATRRDEFCDLNRPVTVTTSTAPQQVYPIVNPDATDPAKGVEGFSLDPSNPHTGGANPLPMPVRWIYVRENGALVTYATAQGVNDVVARIAFWGDDETCKVNINTASDGVYYDAPVANTIQDHNLGRFQPIAQEYQRFPGHPSTTSLAAVLPEIRTEADPVVRSQQAAALTPRIAWGGSLGGTVQAWRTRNLGKLDADRLLSGIDELSFQRDSSGRWLNAGKRTVSALNIDPTRLGFFLTTESRAPELNVFNRPRITLWPFNKELIDTDSESSQKLTPEDRLIRLASEIGANHRPLYFQREDAWDPFNDYTNITGNTELYAYLQEMTGKSIPGAISRTGGSANNLAQKYTPLGRDQILTEMFDYLRSQVNTMNRAYEPVGGPVYSFPQGHDLNNTGFNDRSPLLIDAGNGMTKGIGSGGVTLTEFIMQLYSAVNPADSPPKPAEKVADFFNNTTGAPGPDGKMDTVLRQVQMIVLLNFSMSVNTLSSAMPRFQVKLDAPNLFLNPNPNGVPIALSEQVFVRPAGAGQPDNANWSTAPLAVGLPPTSTNVYCSNVTQMDLGVNTNIFGGSLGMSYGLRFDTNGKASSDFLASVGEKKTLDPAASGDFRRYPFVSQMMEFRIPLLLDPATHEPTLVAITGQLIPRSDPSIVGLENALGPLNATPATVTTYPGLQKPANPANLTSDNSLANLQPPSNSNYLQRVQLLLESTKLPLPKLGPDTVLTATWQAGNSPKKTYSQLANYSSRLDYQNIFPGDMMMLVPNGPEGASSWIPNGQQTMSQMDSFRSYVLSSTSGAKGDFRVAAARRDIPATWFEPNANYASPNIYLGMDYLPTFLARYAGPETYRIGTFSGPGAWDLAGQISSMIEGANFAPDGSRRAASSSMKAALKANSTEGDFTNGYGFNGDGALIKGPDIGAITADGDALTTGESPYFSRNMSRSGTSDDTTVTDTYHTNFTGLVYSPWKQMPSAVKFGTLPSRVTSGAPWETLLFNPVPAGGKTHHRGWTELPRDHYWIDLFYMPVVEPYAITENFATTGKINLNEQVAPFTYIRRHTGLYALLRNLKILAIPTTASVSYKSANVKISGAGSQEYRRPVDIASTAALISDRLKNDNDPFVTASEITEIPMLFDGRTASNIEAYWDTLKLSGDDSREAPYNALYPRVTTKSNTFKIHFVAQTLSGKGGKWKVQGEYRGSQIVERYLAGLSGVNASKNYGTGSTPATQFPALAGNDSTGTPYYRFRKTNHQQFSP